MKDTRELDRIDRRILKILQGDARISNVELARQVNLSPTPCLERVRRLEREKYILDYVALLNPQKLDAALVAYVEISLDRTTTNAFERFKEAVMRLDMVQECQMVAGGFDYLMKVRVADMVAYRKFLGENLAAIEGVSQTHTYVVMEEVKATTAIPIVIDERKAGQALKI
jgi:Lrp/AsnC family leucine-responsive transcriptional regulator